VGRIINIGTARSGFPIIPRTVITTLMEETGKDTPLSHRMGGFHQEAGASRSGHENRPQIRQGYPPQRLIRLWEEEQEAAGLADAHHR